MLARFKRITSSGKFIPQIDGLRFVAIFSVLLFHLNGDLLKKNFSSYIDKKGDYKLFNTLLMNGDRGVLLFFAISGFILALPFANHYMKGLKKPALKSYFTRRLTRLEPPYIIIMILLFIANVYIARRVAFSQLFPSLLASLCYTNNIFNHNGIWPYVNVVTWSLEIEVQFYLLAPLLAYVFSYSSAIRRSVLLFMIFAFPQIHNFIHIPFKSIVDYIQYFSIGFLLADFYISYSKGKQLIPDYAAVPAGLILFILFWAIPSTQAIFNLAFPFTMLAVFYLGLFTNAWKKVLSISIVTTIGGMCYTIYLVHFAIISAVNNATLKYKMTHSYVLNLTIQYLIALIAVLSVSALLFLLIEKPCMEKDWPKKFMGRFKMLSRLVTIA